MSKCIMSSLLMCITVFSLLKIKEKSEREHPLLTNHCRKKAFTRHIFSGTYSLCWCASTGACTLVIHVSLVLTKHFSLTIGLSSPLVVVEREITITMLTSLIVISYYTLYQPLWMATDVGL